MVNEAVRLLVDRMKHADAAEGRRVVFPSALVVGDSCAPLRA
jgi:LacI family transcriptional regulator, galactose operon repressor